MRIQKKEPIRLDDLAVSRLPDRIIKAIGDTELSVTEMTEYISGQPSWDLHREEDSIVIRIQIRIPVKKMLTALGGMIGILWAAKNFIFSYWPFLQAFFQGGKPGP